MTVQKKATSVDSFSKMELLFYYSRLSENFFDQGCENLMTRYFS